MVVVYNNSMFFPTLKEKYGCCMQQLPFFPTLTEKYSCCIQQPYFSVRVGKNSSCCIQKYCCCIKKQQKNTFFVILSTEEKAITTEKMAVYSSILNCASDRLATFLTDSAGRTVKNCCSPRGPWFDPGRPQTKCVWSIQ